MNTGPWIPQDFYDATTMAIRERDPELLSRCCRWAGVTAKQDIHVSMRNMEPIRQTLVFGNGIFAVGWELASEERQ
jgi:hypothetical protein